MNLNELFQKQAELDKRIVEEHNLQDRDLLKKKCVALICELYECANEARFFKFWSIDQKARTEKKIECHACQGVGEFAVDVDHFVVETETCGYCDGTGFQEIKNPLLEEYVDTLHFALSIANDLGYTEHTFKNVKDRDSNWLLLGLTNLITLIPEGKLPRHNIETVMNYLIQFGYKLGFDEQTVKQAYYKKYKENFRRQEVGY